MSSAVLDINNLAVSFDTPEGVVEAVKGVTLSIAKGECLGIVGESGAGKSQIFLSAFGLSSETARITGSAKFSGQELLGLARKELDNIRGRYAAFVFQDPLTALSPHMKIGAQMCEALIHHLQMGAALARERAQEWLERVRIPGAARRLDQYPHELSAGMRQRVVIAMAMMCDPALLIADEPTSALDATVQAQILHLIEDLRKDTHVGVALITRDLGVIARMAQRVAVMHQGELVETDSVKGIFASPIAEYTRKLVKAAPRTDSALALAPSPAGEAPALLSVEDLRVHFPVKVESGLFRNTKLLPAVDGVGFEVRAGETLGVIGESGAGKSTLARAVAQLAPRDAGAVSFLGRSLLPSERETLARVRQDLQMVFQDPLASLDPCMTLGNSIGEPLLAFAPELDRADREARVRAIMGRVGLGPDLFGRYPHELSGGQNQRACIARAMIMKPKLVICDEAVASLDILEQVEVLRLLADLQRDFGVSFVFISSDLAAVRQISHNVLVLYLGRAVEYGPADLVFSDPRHPYTRALLAAALAPDPEAARARPRARFEGEPQNPLDSRAALGFLKSRMIDDPDAVQYRPHWDEIAPGRFVAEHDSEQAA